MTASTAMHRTSGFLAVALTIAVGLLWVIGWYWTTALEMAGIWWRSDTYAHGLVVLPIFAWLVWRARERIQALRPEPIAWLALPAALGGFLWLLGGLVSVAAAQHFALVVMMCSILAGALGWKLSRILLFPILFLFFGVPIGDFMLPTLMHYTAEFTVWALRLSGVPVYQEGLHFVVPNGRWSVVEACSGVRYLIASLMVGSLYAYLNYSSLRRRLVFMLVAIVLPIFANWLRAYMIVMLGYLSGNTIAVGVDHILYGWVFFGVIIFLLFWIGSRWHENSPGPAPDAGAPVRAGVGNVRALVVLALAVVPYPYVLHALDAPSDDFQVTLTLPTPEVGWEARDEAATAYRPSYVGARAEAFAHFAQTTDSMPVDLLVAWYYGQRDGSEMLSWGNGPVPQRPRGIDVLRREVRLASNGTAVVQSFMTNPAGRMLVWHVYRLDGRTLHQDGEVKIRLAIKRLFGRDDESAAIVLMTPVIDDVDRASQRLDAFLIAHQAEIERSIDQLQQSIPE